MSELDIQCKSCSGTGLYVGMAEKDGCAVVCTTCKGRGGHILTYTPYTGRKLRADIMRVFKRGCGYVQSCNDVLTKDGVLIKFSEGGATYKDWLEGVPLKPVKELYCPYMWEGQDMQCSDHPEHDMYMARCRDGLRIGEDINKCKHYSDKKQCWDMYEG